MWYYYTTTSLIAVAIEKKLTKTNNQIIKQLTNHYRVPITDYKLTTQKNLSINKQVVKAN